MTVMELEKPWAELDGQDARLTHFAVPRPKK
jgi:phosphohistidine phosphatase